MRKSWYIILLTSLLICWCESVWAFGKTTIDPNTLPSVEQKSFWDIDDRLSQKVTYEARKKTALAIMDDLTKMSGVTINSGYNSKDWQVRDRKMIIIAKDMPLKELMQSIARVMKFKWSRSESEPYTYRIYMDRRTLLDAEGQAYRAERKYEEYLTKRREVLADKMKSAAEIDTSELENIKETDPYTYVLAKTGFAGQMAQLLQQVPAAREAFLYSSQTQINGSQLTEDVKPVAALLAQAMYRFSRMYASRESEDYDNDKPIEVLRIEFNIDDRNPSYPFMRQFYLGQIAMQWKQGNTTHATSFPFMDPETKIGKTAGLQFQMQMEKAPGDPDPEPLATKFSGEEMKQLISQSYFGEPVVTHTAEELAAFSKISVSDTRTPKYSFTDTEDWILTTAKVTGMNVVSDYLGKGISHTVGEGSNWWLHGNTFEYRDLYWFKKRSLQVPESYIEPWREHFKENGTLEIDDLAQIAALTGEQEQYAVNINGDEVLGNESMRMAILGSNQRNALRFYDSLTKDQREALFSDDGLSQDSLTAKQKDDLLRIAPYYTSNYTKPLKMNITRSPGLINYQVIMLTYSNIPIFSVWTPKYEPPKKEEPVISDDKS